MTATARAPRARTDEVILAIDPGPTESAWLAYEIDPRPGYVVAFAKVDNEHILGFLRGGLAQNVTHVVIEQVASYGMAVGAEVFETCVWTGRFMEAVHQLPVERITRLNVKLRLCHDSRAKDSNIRQALIDRYGGPAAIGRKAAPGPLYGVSGDVWSALSVAVAWSEISRGNGGER